MRLTLRTLLAYTDDILDPADHEDLGKKIEASDFATELIHRSRDVVRRLRLGAPEVMADGGDDVLDSIDVSDANAVAEYLDNTLSPDDVADFERMCLEPGNDADMHLAEVASCHHVLTMVLGEPADIDLDVRNRMYDLPEKLGSGQQLRIEPGHVEAPPVVGETSAAVEEAASVVAPASVETVSEVPDYLRAASASRQRGKFLVIAACLLVLAGIAGFFVLGSGEEPVLPEEIADADLGAAIGNLEINDGGDSPVLDSPPETAPEESSEEPPIEEISSQNTDEEAAPELNSEQPVEVFEEEPSQSTPVAEETTETVDSSPLDLDSEFPELPVPEPEDSQDLNVDPTKKGPLLDAPALDAEKPEMEPGAAEQEPTSEEPQEVVADEESVEEGVTDSEEVVTADPATEEPPVAQGPEKLGKYMGNNDMLLRYDNASNKWVRMPPRSELLTDSYLLALPKYRVHVVLADVNTYLSGGTRIALPLRDNAAEQSDLQLVLDYGRVLFNAGLKGSVVSMRIGSGVRRIQMAGSTSLAVEVERIFVPGSNNELQSSPVETTWYLTSGSVELLTEDAEPQVIEAPAVWSTIAGVDEPAQALEQLPSWIDHEVMTDLQRRARNTLIEELVPGEPVEIRLLELNDPQGKGRRSEVRTLAAEAGVYVGQFEPFVKALSDKDQRRAWDSHIKTLRQALALSPDVAANVRKAFVELRGEQAATDLMEMISGYDPETLGETPEEVQEGVIASLVRRLESDNLDYRVLAIHNLDEIFESNSLKGFRAVDSAQRRKIAVAKIWDGLQSGELLPKP